MSYKPSNISLVFYTESMVYNKFTGNKRDDWYNISSDSSFFMNIYYPTATSVF